MTFMETDAYFPVFRPSLQCWVFSCGLWFRLTRLGCGWSQFCRSWTLASGSFFRKSKRIMVTVTLNTLNVLFHMLGNRYMFHSNKVKIQNTFKNEPQQTSHSHKTHTTYLVFVPVYQTSIFSFTFCLQYWTETVFFLSERRIMQAQTEKENIESDLSSMFPKVGSSSHLDLITPLWRDRVHLKLIDIQYTWSTSASDISCAKLNPNSWFTECFTRNS